MFLPIFLSSLPVYSSTSWDECLQGNMALWLICDLLCGVQFKGSTARNAFTSQIVRTVKWVHYTLFTNMLQRFWYNQGLLRSFPDFDVVKGREQHVCPCSHAVFSLADTCCHLCKNESVFQLPTLVVSVYFYEHRPSVWLRLVLCWPCSYSAESQGTLTLTFLSFDVNWCQWKIPQALMWLTLLL